MGRQVPGYSDGGGEGTYVPSLPPLPVSGFLDLSLPPCPAYRLVSASASKYLIPWRSLPNGSMWSYLFLMCFAFILTLSLDLPLSRLFSISLYPLSFLLEGEAPLDCGFPEASVCVLFIFV